MITARRGPMRTSVRLRTRPFDFTLTFCEVMPLSDKEIKDAEAEHVVRAPVRAKIVVPVQFVPNLIAALQEHWRVFSESYSNVGWNKGAGPFTDGSGHGSHPRQCESGDEERHTRRDILDKLEAQHPGADTELHYANAFQLLVATILSAQSTDQRVNLVTPALFKRYPQRAHAGPRHRQRSSSRRFIRPDFSAPNRRRSSAWRRRWSHEHGGEVPADMDALVELPGVGRKTANVVLGHALGVPGLPVDRHVLRVANRIGIAESDDPGSRRAAVVRALPPDAGPAPPTR